MALFSLNFKQAWQLIIIFKNSSGFRQAYITVRLLKKKQSLFCQPFYADEP
jgi:hypothetical protein